LYCNFAAVSFLSENFVVDFIQLEFYSKKEKFAFEPPFGRLRGNVRTSSIARWKARMYDFLFVVIMNFIR